MSCSSNWKTRINVSMMGFSWDLYAVECAFIDMIKFIYTTRFLDVPLTLTNCLDTLADHLPELVGRVENADQITLRMRLQHRSGIPNLVDHPDCPWFKTLPDRDTYLAFTLDEPADSEPGSDYHYSNTGYLLI